MPIIRRHRRERLTYVEYRNASATQGDELKDAHGRFARCLRDSSTDDFTARYIIWFDGRWTRSVLSRGPRAHMMITPSWQRRLLGWAFREGRFHSKACENIRSERERHPETFIRGRSPHWRRLPYPNWAESGQLRDDESRGCIPGCSSQEGLVGAGLAGGFSSLTATWQITRRQITQCWTGTPLSIPLPGREWPCQTSISFHLPDRKRQAARADLMNQSATMAAHTQEIPLSSTFTKNWARVSRTSQMLAVDM